MSEVRAGPACGVLVALAVAIKNASSPMSSPKAKSAFSSGFARGGMTRARQHLHLMYPMRLFRSYQHRHGDGHVLTLRSRFIPDSILGMFERCAQGRAVSQPIPAAGPSIRIDVAARMRERWE